MIQQFRHFSETWFAKILFGLLAIFFVGWGISSDLLQIIEGRSTWVAKIGSETIDGPIFQAEFQRAVQQQSQNLPSGQEMPAPLRAEIGQQTLHRMIAQAAIEQELRKLRIVTPDQTVIATVHAMPQFKDKDGNFSKPMFDNALRNAGYTEQRFLAAIRGDVSQQQLLGTITSSVGASDLETTPIYDVQLEKRAADTALIPLGSPPAAPDQAVLQRWFDNHPDLYTSPEYRRIKAIELTPQSVGADIKVTDEELRNAYDEQKAQYVTPEKRSAEVISVSDEAKAKALAAKWQGGADWTAMQAAAKDAGAAALSEEDALQVQFPDPDLAKAVFAAPSDTISAPIKGQLSWFVVKVTKIAPGSTSSFDQVKNQLRDQVIASKAADLLYDKANKVDQILGNGGSLDEIPGDLGVVGISGTLDAQGMTPAGSPAPIPGPAELRKAIMDAAFKTQPGDPPNLTEVRTPSTGGSSYYALMVQNIQPPAPRPYDAVKDQVLADWTQDQQRREADKAATAMMVSVQGGKSFSDAATIAGVTPHMTDPVTRQQQTQQIPPDLQRQMFAMKLGDVTMVEVPQGFVVAQLREVQKPDAATDKLGYDRLKAAVAKSIGEDATAVFVAALQQRVKPQIDQKNYDSIVQTH